MKSNFFSSIKSVSVFMLVFLFGCGDSSVVSSDSYNDETPPVVESTSPANGAGTIVGTSIVITFSEAMDITSISANTEDTACTGTIQVSADDFTSCVQMSEAPQSNSDKDSFTLQPKSMLTRNQT
ncbi:Ig-like domain-containing protein [bacterium]|nr:Ig-like domain-containing protein [bacterium]